MERAVLRFLPGSGCRGCLQDMSQLLENVFADPKGFGIGPDGRYRYEQPGFTAGTAEVS